MILPAVAAVSRQPAVLLVEVLPQPGPELVGMPFGFLPARFPGLVLENFFPVTRSCLLPSSALRSTKDNLGYQTVELPLESM